ncbi:MAG: Asp-tRNA(Asn)/Glu-tRNA(Gln) amidotransferase subunit GatB, partial [Chlamydiota bacterium]|nr:Asp-tRNA(Asn)/Glu-tRNA(Gln) amidotransferase subunit GatB [Chlamydiota bacterium]
DSYFDRKSYFYPDSPRNFQITQFYHPILKGGSITTRLGGEERTFAISHTHLEDDAGMLKHFSHCGGVDYNRAGVPLLEIVSEPCFRCPKEATAYVIALRAMLQYLDVSDGNMEEGSLRIDTNVSVRIKGEQRLRNKVEIKNLNSFDFMEMGIEAEMRRQVRAYEKSPHLPPHQVLPASTVRLDVNRQETLVMREKEGADDYRYFPEPDLPPIYLTHEEVESIRRELPELPHARYLRYTGSLGLTKDQADVLLSDPRWADHFDQALTHWDHPRAICNWIIGEWLGRFKERDRLLSKESLPPRDVAHLVELIDKGQITGRIAKEIADLMADNPGLSPEEAIANNPHFVALTDSEAIDAIIEEVIAHHKQSAIDFCNGKEKAFNFLVGQVMKASKGQASPNVAKERLREALQRGDWE